MPHKVLTCPNCSSRYLVLTLQQNKKFVCKKCGRTLVLKVHDPSLLADQPNKSKDPLIGQVLGNCKILEEIGRGAMGVVYKAIHQGLERNVALKVLAPKFTEKKAYVDRFKKEALTVAKLESPNIVQIYNIGCEMDRHFIEVQFIDGENLDEYVERLQFIKLPVAIAIIEDIANGLKLAHSKGILHRDIKPANIMIPKKGGAKLSDFGLACFYKTASEKDISKVVGTPFYMAPEQCQGLPVNVGTDIYSLGVTFYYMLLGEKPFTAKSAAAIFEKHIHERPVEPIKINPALPLAVNDIIMKMLEKNPARRQRNVEELLNDLEALKSRRQRKAEKQEATDTRTCPHCGQTIKKIALKCRFCGKFLSEGAKTSNLKQCPFCGKIIHAKSTSCVHCGAHFRGLDKLRVKAIKTCPFCHEKVKSDSSICEYCGEVIDSVIER